MSTQVTIPPLGESITEATVGQWLKQPGDAVAADEPIVSLETDKVAVEVPSPIAGTMGEQMAKVGDTVSVGSAIARIEGGAADGAVRAAAPTPAVVRDVGASAAQGAGAPPEVAAPSPAAPDPYRPAPSAPTGAPAASAAPDPYRPEPPAGAAIAAPEPPTVGKAGADAPLSPSVRRIVGERGLDPATLAHSGPGDRISKADALAAKSPPSTSPALAAQAVAGAAAPSVPATPTPASIVTPRPAATTSATPGERREERVRMTRLRQTIARRLKEAQNTAAMLTTFNDVDMSAVMHARDLYKESFEKKHGVRLGFMSFFTRAAVLALREVPAVNAMIDGEEIVYRQYADIGVAVSSPGGLVVPILKNADARSFADIEKAIGDFGRRARDGQLKLEELQGGTFTISNGGVFGSLMSTPILNPPQSGVLGLHRIEERPVARDGAVVIRPMMYLALSYDHRVVDGREAVTFLVRIKEAIEDPVRLLLDM